MMKLQTTLLIAIFLLLSANAQVPTPTRQYDASLVLRSNPRMTIYWRLDPYYAHLAYVCQPPLDGYCGLGWHSVRLMTGGDAIIAGTDENDNIYVGDYLLNGRFSGGVNDVRCPQAVCLDTFDQFPSCVESSRNVTSRREGNFIVVEFARPILPEDACDRKIAITFNDFMLPNNTFVDYTLLWAMGTGRMPRLMNQHAFYGTVSASVIMSPNRLYYVAAELVEWDYAPNNPGPRGDTWLRQDATHIGNKYYKIKYVAYTDSTFTSKVIEPAHKGILGPTLRARPNEKFTILFKNNLPTGGPSLNMRPVGLVVRNSTHELVAPGQLTTYTWEVPASAGPTGSTSLLLYHGDIEGSSGVDTGLIGPIVITNTPKANWNLVPTDANKEFFLFYHVFDENKSYYLDENIANKTTGSVNKNDEDFLESNKMRSINGFMFDNVPDLSMGANETVIWYVASFGDIDSIHAPSWYGHTVTEQGSRKATLGLLPASMNAVTMILDTPGVWKLDSAVNSYAYSGMTATYNVTGTPRWVGPSGQERQYFISAESVEWNYAPFIKPEKGELWLNNTQDRIGSSYYKIRYVGYTSEDFTTPSPVEEWQGILGPIIRATVGDTIIVKFRNNVPNGPPLTIHAQGVQYNATIVANPGETITLRWYVPTRAGPAANDPNSIMWLYYSDVNNTLPGMETNSGLVGPLIITGVNATKSPSDLSPVGVDKEFVLLYTIFDENESFLFDSNIANFTTSSIDKNDPQFIESNRMHSINGYSFNNLPGLEMSTASRVRWYVAALGSISDVHAPHWKGQTFVETNFIKNTLSLVPAKVSVVDMTPDNPGLWDLQCSVTNHMNAGMIANFNVTGDPVMPPTTGNVREYFIAAEEVEWNYVPFKNPLPVGATWLENSATRIGSRYRKIVYKEYTSASFTTQKSPSEAWSHKGILGPVIRAVVGDTISIVFKNDVPAGGPALNIRPDGLFYDIKENSPVQPGETANYTWYVPARSSGNLTSAMWLYHSDTSDDAGVDVNTGLIGPIIITAAGYVNESNGLAPIDLDQEFVLLFTVFDENKSYLISDNIDNHTTSAVDVNDPLFIESNRMHSINGYMYDNLEFLLLNDAKARFYVAAVGNEKDIHSPYWDGQTGTTNSVKTSIVNLTPGTIAVLDLNPINPGTWTLATTVRSYREAGMSARFNVSSLSIRPTTGTTGEIDWTTTSTSTTSASTSVSTSTTGGSTSSTSGSNDAVDSDSDDDDTDIFPIWLLIAIIVIVILGVLVGVVAALIKKRSDSY